MRSGTVDVDTVDFGKLEIVCAGKTTSACQARTGPLYQMMRGGQHSNSPSRLLHLVLIHLSSIVLPLFILAEMYIQLVRKAAQL